MDKEKPTAGTSDPRRERRTPPTAIEFAVRIVLAHALCVSFAAVLARRLLLRIVPGFALGWCPPPRDSTTAAAQAQMQTTDADSHQHTDTDTTQTTGRRTQDNSATTGQTHRTTRKDGHTHETHHDNDNTKGQQKQQPQAEDGAVAGLCAQAAPTLCRMSCGRLLLLLHRAHGTRRPMRDRRAASSHKTGRLQASRTTTTTTAHTPRPMPLALLPTPLRTALFSCVSPLSRPCLCVSRASEQRSRSARTCR